MILLILVNSFFLFAPIDNKIKSVKTNDKDEETINVSRLTLMSIEIVTMKIISRRIMTGA